MQRGDLMPSAAAARRAASPGAGAGEQRPTTANGARRAEHPTATKGIGFGNNDDPMRCDAHVGGNAQPASAQMLQEPKVASLEEPPEPTTLGESITVTTSSSPPALSSRHCHPSSPGSTIWTRDPADSPWIYHIRMDLGGCFHTYPHLGGPFLSLDEAEDAINHHLHRLRCPTIFNEQDGVFPAERAIQEYLYWPDGTRKKYSKSRAIQNIDNLRRQMVQVLLDKYNNDHGLVGDLAYELKDVVHYQLIVEGLRWFEHFNFTAKTEGADDCCINNLFFAEVMYLQGEDAWVVSCCCILKSDDNGLCYGCKNGGNVDMKHPNDVHTYTGFHQDIRLPFESEEWTDSDEDEDVTERRRRLTEGLDDPAVWEMLFG